MKCEDTPSGKLCFGANDDNWKPNYLSVMNYRYQFSGITPAKVSGGVEAFACAADADCPAHLYCHGGVCSRVDYSAERLPTGGNTPGALEESTLDGLPGLSEPAGLGGATSDVFTYTDARCDIPPTTAATVGPVDWDGDGNTDATAVSADLTAGGDHPCGKVQLALLAGAADWGGPFTYKFQCTSFGGPDGDGSSSSSSSSFPWRLTRELTTHEAMAAHALYPPRSVRAILGDGSARIMRARNRIGSVRVILLGAPGFAMADVDTASIVFHGARPVTVTLRDVNRDGRPDLVAAFDSARLRLHPKATRARIRGSLASSQLFTAEIALP
jgi:hypothetical protein